MPRSRASVVLFSLSALLACASPRVWADASASLERIAVNDNRVAAGALEGTTLTLRLEAREGEWHPDADTDPGLPVRAFGVEGGALQIPGPLIRVREGTDVRVFVRNRLDTQPLVVHGFSGRTARPSGVSDGVTINTGEVREIRFVASTPGTYYYWGATSDVPLVQRTAKDTQLSGAFIVEPRGVPPVDDRIFVIGVWPAAGPNGVIAPGTLIRMVMNGKSWPHTERLSYAVGDTVHIRVLSPGSAVHPMHLHGFYFNVDSRGDGETDTVYPRDGSPHLVNTERLAPGRTMTFTWLPTRPGNWLFHCHDTAHIAGALPLDGGPPPPHHHVANHALEMLSGPDVGITIRPKPGDVVAPETAPRRALRLVARVDEGGTAEEPAYGFTLEEGTAAPPAPPYQPTPVIVLQRGEPVSITVVNQLPEATAIHWHGIELESYYDGVAGFAGDAARLAPAIEPGASFEARMTPPRSGTFIYHTHVDEMRQQQAGLNGALLVVDDRARYDPAHDIVLVVSVPRRAADSNVVLINGSLAPPPIEMKVGERYRLRFVDIHVFRPSMRMRLLTAEGPLTWRAVAKDGMDLPADQAIAGPSQIQMGNGETYDFEFVPDTARELRVDVETATGVLLARVPIHVR
jgi:FtsP/CotA-like multicopper oxidase with cupredoxin domain